VFSCYEGHDRISENALHCSVRPKLIGGPGDKTAMAAGAGLTGARRWHWERAHPAAEPICITHLLQVDNVGVDLEQLR